MPDYDFQSLSTYDFELLARDLLQQELGIRLESFGRGPDAGIDFRFRTLDGDTVVQCKHYRDFDVLFRILKRDEAPKVQRLQPRRYILVLSASLTPKRKEDILKLFSPYCQGTPDILGREDVNNLLGRHEKIERKSIKLWLTSEAVLTRFLQNGVWQDSELSMERIRQRTCRYVPNPSLPRAGQILDKHHYCIIAGIPGIGKTTLAEILLIEYADRHDFQPIRIANDLSEIKAIKNPHHRQIFYFDDFLGTTALDKLQKNEDKRLMEFIEEVIGNKNWRFILTTREYILNAARIRYESLAHPPVDLTPCIVDLADYTQPIRAKILYNHIFFSALSDEHKRALLEDRHYQNIVSHQNYNPRIIEHMTQPRYVASVLPNEYFAAFIDNLTNPARIWDHAFRNQLTEAAQHLLLVLASLPDEVLLSDWEKAFEKFYHYRQKRIGFNTSTRDFEHALKQLDGNFIKTTLIGKDRIVVFHNPSVSDYLEAYLANSPNDVSDLVETVSFFEQFQNLWRGRGGTRFNAIDKHSRQFIYALSRNFAALNCRVIRVRSGQDFIGVRHWNSSFEYRMAFAIEVVDELKTPESEAMLNQLLEILRKRISDRQSRKDDLVQLLTEPVFRRLDPDQSILRGARAYLIHKLEEYDDFSSVGKFVQKFPEAISPDDLTRVRKDYAHFSRDYADGWESDPELLRSIAEEIATVGKQLQVDVTGLTERLNERAEELETEPRPEDYEGSEPDDDWRQQIRQFENTDSMFEGLLTEINERLF